MHVWELASVAAAQRWTRSSNLDRTAVLFPSAACCTQTPPKRRCFLQQPHSTFQKMPEVKRTDSSFSASQRTHVWLTANHKQLTATPYRYHIMLIVRTCKLQQSHQQNHQLNETAHALLWWQEILWTSRTRDWKLTTFRVNWKKKLSDLKCNYMQQNKQPQSRCCLCKQVHNQKTLLENVQPC